MQQTPSLAVRLTCLIYETLLVVAVLFIGFLLPHAVLGWLTHVVVPGTVMFAHIYLLLAIYFVWQWSPAGQTLAMKTWRIRLVGADGHAASRGQALLRYTLAWFSCAFFGAGFLWALIDREGLFLHDRLAGTRLLRLPKTT